MGRHDSLGPVCPPPVTLTGTKVAVHLSGSETGMLAMANKKGKFLYSAVSSPQDHSKHFTLYFHDRPVQSDTISASLGSIQPYATN